MKIILILIMFSLSSCGNNKSLVKLETNIVKRTKENFYNKKEVSVSLRDGFVGENPWKADFYVGNEHLYATNCLTNESVGNCLNVKTGDMDVLVLNRGRLISKRVTVILNNKFYFHFKLKKRYVNILLSKTNKEAIEILYVNGNEFEDSE